MQFAWFYKPPADGDLSTLAQHFDVFILTHKDEAERDALRQQGVTAPILQYLSFEAIHDPGRCEAVPTGNQVAHRAGDFCDLSERHPDWFLLDTHGRRMVHDGDVMMDPGHPEWRAFWLERARQSQESLGWDGVFLDNVEASLSKRVRRGAVPAAYSDDASYQAAIEGFLDYLYTNYFQPRGRPLFANIIELDNAEVWTRYLRHLDGAMIEAFAVGWDDYRSPGHWEEQLRLVELAQSLGKRMVLVSQGTRDDTAREMFAFASYLLVANGGTSFRYTHSSAYEELWVYSNYLLELGEPLGPRYSEGGIWRRDFAGGTVSVDPESHRAGITIRE